MLRFARTPLVQAAGLMAMAARNNSHVFTELKNTLIKKRNELAPKIKRLKEEKGDHVLSTATVDKAYGGMRDIIGLVYEPSLLDAQEGIRFRGYSIPECQKLLPKAAGGVEPLPEAMFWLLLTGDVPTSTEVSSLQQELFKRACPDAIAAAEKAINGLPANAHPMTQYAVGILALQTYSKFAKAYAAGKANKDNYWELALDDTLDCVARTPAVAAMIYRRLTTGSTALAEAPSKDLDWSANFCRGIGFKSKEFDECMRLYLTIHVDHEGGNVSAHTTGLVGSALSDPYLAYCAGMNGLAGPLHGLANQEVLTYIFEMRDKCKAAGVNMQNAAELEKALDKFTWDLLNAKKVVPGYGHAVLRKTDPRYDCQRDFCLRNGFQDDLFKLVDTIYKIMPGILTKHGKTKNPYPNVDAHSGVLLQHYGMTQQEYYTVLFGLSRQLGVLSGLIWDRLEGRPLERPKSVTTEWLLKELKMQ